MEFRIVEDNASDRRRELRARIFLWGTVGALSCVCLFAVYGVRYVAPQTTTVLVWISALLVGAAIAASYFLAFRHGLEKLERGLTFVLADGELIRKKTGYPDVRIRLSEIKALYDRRSWLVVERRDPPLRIAIPDKVADFKSLRAELSKHASIVVVQQSLLLRSVAIFVSVISWALVLWSKDAVVVTTSAIVGSSMLAWETLRIYRLSRRSRTPLVFWFLIALGWAGPVLVIFFRIMRALRT